MVAAMIDRLETGQSFDTLPAHMTVLPWFDLASNEWPDLHDELEDVVSETPMPVVMGGDEAVYGSEDPQVVRKLNRLTPSFNLIHGFDIHARLYGAVRQRDGQFDETYTGLAWSPHVTATPERAIDEGEMISFDNLTVFVKQALYRQKTVKSVHRWKKAYEATS